MTEDADRFLRVWQLHHESLILNDSELFRPVPFPYKSPDQTPFGHPVPDLSEAHRVSLS